MVPAATLRRRLRLRGGRHAAPPARSPRVVERPPARGSLGI